MMTKVELEKVRMAIVGMGFSIEEVVRAFSPPTVSKVTKGNSLDIQIGGDHYKNMAIQPVTYTHKNDLNFCQGNIIKYATRYKSKNGAEDLDKVIHYAELLKDLEYGDKNGI